MAGKTVLFQRSGLNERGVSVAIYHYAKYNEEILGNTSVIACDAGGDQFSLDLFKTTFQNVILYPDDEALYKLTEDADLCYMLTSGNRPGIDLEKIKCRVGIHSVFTAHDPHGDIYATISEWVADCYALSPVPVVPHIVVLPEEDTHLRSELGIPEDAVVFGRYGGYEQFNMLSAMQTVVKCINNREDVYFLFLNTYPFCEHPRVFFLNKTHDMNLKTRFINTCDAMLHARREGETFGLSIGEFSLRQKPIITWYWSFDRHHINVLKENGIYYRTAFELYDILMHFKRGETRPDCYSAKYNPEAVMLEFEKVFLSF